MPQRFLFVLAAFLGLAASGLAHESKALASRLALDQGSGRTTIYLSWGHRLPVDDLIDADSIDRCQQFARALVVAGTPGKFPVKPAGLPLEIVPVEGPAAWKSGATVRFRVLFEGKPLAGETLLATHVGFRPDDAWCFATGTGHGATGSVRFRRPGTWVLKVAVKKPATSTARADYDFESFTTTLTLEVRP